jgi:hypothetical protein
MAVRAPEAEHRANSVPWNPCDGLEEALCSPHELGPNELACREAPRQSDDFFQISI